MRYIWLWIAVLSLSGCLIGSGLNISEKDIANKPNLLQNADFETGPDASGTLPGWLGLSGKDASVLMAADTALAVSGANCLRVSGSDGKILLCSENFEVRSHTLYYCRLSVRSTGNSRLPVTMKVVTFDGAGNLTDQAYYRHVPGKDWFKMELNTGLFRRTVVSARFIVELPAAPGERYWLDDAGIFEAYMIPNTANNGGSMKKSERFVYDRKSFCIPVTKAEPLDSIQFIIDDFVRKGITFCIDGDGDQWEIWRLVEEGDSDKIKKTGMPDHPKHLYVSGRRVEQFESA